jgi:hypothetical protein
VCVCVVCVFSYSCTIRREVGGSGVGGGEGMLPLLVYTSVERATMRRREGEREVY